jgi:hypothetical protein
LSIAEFYRTLEVEGIRSFLEEQYTLFHGGVGANAMQFAGGLSRQWSCRI